MRSHTYRLCNRNTTPCWGLPAELWRLILRPTHVIRKHLRHHGSGNGKIVTAANAYAGIGAQAILKANVLPEQFLHDVVSVMYMRAGVPLQTKTNTVFHPKRVIAEVQAAELGCDSRVAHASGGLPKLFTHVIY